MRAMDTVKLYWERPYETEFVATVVECQARRDSVDVVLDQTLFYPEGGGQPCDTGWLQIEPGSGIPIRFRVDEVKQSGGKIVHTIRPADSGQAGDVSAIAEGLKVLGQIDGERRLDLSQQHTGQHILSRVFETRLRAHTVGFHIGSDYVTIDLDIQSLPWDEAQAVMLSANEIAYRNLPVTWELYDPQEVPAHIRIRLDPGPGMVRVVHIGDFDACACGGTHVSSSAQAAPIVISQLDRAHGGVRVVFRCGMRAIRDYLRKQALLDSASKVLSQGADSLPEAVAALVWKMREAEKEIEDLRRQKAELEIEKIVVGSGGLNREKPVVAVLRGKNPEELRFMAARICDGSGRLTVLIAPEPRFSMVVARPRQNGGLWPDARAIVSAASARWGGRGGGTPELAQLGSKEPLSLTEEEMVAGVLDIVGEMSRHT